MKEGLRVIWKIHQCRYSVAQVNRFSQWLKFGKRKSIQRESCKWRRDREGSTSIRGARAGDVVKGRNSAEAKREQRIGVKQFCITALRCPSTASALSLLYTVSPALALPTNVDTLSLLSTYNSPYESISLSELQPLRKLICLGN